MNKPSKPNLNFATGITHDMPGTSATRRRTERRRRLCFCLLIFSHDERYDLQSNMRKIRKIWPSITISREALVCFVSVKNFSSSTVSQMLTQSLNTMLLCLSFSCVTLLREALVYFTRFYALLRAFISVKQFSVFTRFYALLSQLSSLSVYSVYSLLR